MKVYNYIMLITGMILILELFGINTGVDALLSTFGVQGLSDGVPTFNFSVSAFWDGIFSVTGILTTLATFGVVIIGSLVSRSPENFIILPFITATLVLFGSAFVTIIDSTSGMGALSIIIYLFMVPLAVGFTHSLVEFFRGTD